MTGCSCRWTNGGTVRAFHRTLKRTAFFWRIDKFFGEACCSIVLHEQFLQILFQPSCVCLYQLLLSMPPKNRWTCGIFDNLEEPVPKNADKFAHYGRRWKMRQFDVFCGKVLSKPSVWRLYNRQKTITHLVRERLFSWLEAGWSRCLGGTGLFFNPNQSRLMADAKGSGKTSWRTTFLGRLDDHFFEFLALSNRLKHPTKAARLTLVLRVARCIRPVFHNLFRATFMAAFYI